MNKKCNRIRAKLGDVVEISTSKGLTYVQYINEHKDPPVLGELIQGLLMKKI